MPRSLPPCLAVLALAGLTAPAPARQPPADVGAQAYQRVLQSIVWVHSPRGEGREATGTGTLVDKARRLVLTNYHVVSDDNRAVVMFPAYRDGRLIAERDYYRDNFRRLGIRGTVVARDRRHDLSLIQLDHVPDGVKALPVATKDVEPGQTVHSVGNPGKSGALWVYTPGRVRQVYMKKWQAKAGNETLSFEARVIETDSPTNPGDSGGPLVNDKAELVGVTQGGAFDARGLSYFIDLAEVRAFLGSRAAESVAAPTTPAPSRGKALTVRDEAKFFSPEAVEKANAEIAELYKKNERDLLIETYPTVPADKAEKVKGMSAEERSKFFSDWAEERLKTENVNGVVVLVCKSPSHLQTKVASRVRPAFNEADGKDLVNLLLKRFRDRQYDEGLAEAVKLVKENLGK
jgi:hypothetical protein